MISLTGSQELCFVYDSGDRERLRKELAVSLGNERESDFRAIPLRRQPKLASFKTSVS